MTRTMTPAELRAHWTSGHEIALIDVREEGPFAAGHPLFALTIPVSEIEVGLPPLVPRKSTSVVVYDDGEGYAERAVPRIKALGYSDVAILAGGLSAYAREGEVYIDVNVPSKAFGELVESIRHTPSLPAEEVKAIIEGQQDVVVLDARRYEEYNTMSIPRGQSVPGGELVYRINDIAPSPDTLVVVNCAGRTRSIIGTQSLINAGIPNRVVALRNGTIGWTLAGLSVETKASARGGDPSAQGREIAQTNARRWADHVGVPIVSAAVVENWRVQQDRTLYLLDVRSPDEYAAGHPPGFISAPGGQLVQATDEWLGVRGARVVLFDDDGVRARMAASWLRQMGWDVAVLEDAAGLSQVAPPKEWQFDGDTVASVDGATVADLARHAVYAKGHIPGAWFVSGPELARDIAGLPGDGPIVLTSPDGRIAAANLAVARAATDRPVHVLAGGTAAWTEGLSTELHEASQPIDAYKRPYEGTDNAREKMQAYIDWELGLVAQLANDGVSRFHVVRALVDRE
ncbi:rhodanese-like domain-containing protein [Paracoccus laeviglucosivorans]|uniref:Rhodanese-related sulfurtransferase n=1 Tax=Paracoccus laeviglucosivorans TaxID=1197861 RepID=A0A521FKJ4_9RHOB|nr:rhodanese-like domain-containing protein [Paracoccus laeviglucosivorans]SMO96742.1 Rhodanese-related sulfurtransferase [Paracoccus laeviglucosivorans]